MNEIANNIITKKELIYELQKEEEYTVLADVTGLVSDLPECITKVTVIVMKYYEFGDAASDELLENAIDEINKGSDFSNGRIYSPGNSVYVTLTGGYTLEACNSEWGGLNIIHN